MNTVKDFNRTLQLWKNAAKEKVMLICGKTFVGFYRNKVKQNIIAVRSGYCFASGSEHFTCVIVFFQFNDSTLTELIKKTVPMSQLVLLYLKNLT